MSRTFRNNHYVYKRPLSFGVIRRLVSAAEYLLEEGYSPRRRDMIKESKYDPRWYDWYTSASFQTDFKVKDNG